MRGLHVATGLAPSGSLCSKDTLPVSMGMPLTGLELIHSCKELMNTKLIHAFHVMSEILIMHSVHAVYTTILGITLSGCIIVMIGDWIEIFLMIRKVNNHLLLGRVRAWGGGG